MFVLFTKKAIILEYIGSQEEVTKRQVGSYIANYSYSYALIKELEKEKYLSLNSSQKIHTLKITHKGKELLELLRQLDKHNAHTEKIKYEVDKK